MVVPLEMWSWESSESLAAVRLQAASPLGAPVVLLPDAPPERGRLLSGQLRFDQTTGDELVRAAVAVEVVVGGALERATLAATPSEGAASCADRLKDGWDQVEVRNQEGCRFVDNGGLTFLEWSEGDAIMHVESRLDPDTLMEWLSDWSALHS